MNTEVKTWNCTYENNKYKTATLNGTTLTIHGTLDMALYNYRWCEEVITTVIIESGIENINPGAFRDCYGLTSVTIPSSVKSIGGSAFSDCTALTSVVIPNGTLSVGYGAFKNCKSLISIAIPSSVRTLEKCILENCDSLDYIINESPAPQKIEETVFMKKDYEKTLLYVPSSAMDSYLCAPVWDKFKKVLSIKDLKIIEIEIALKKGKEEEIYYKKYLEGKGNNDTFWQSRIDEAESKFRQLTQKWLELTKLEPEYDYFENDYYELTDEFPEKESAEVNTSEQIDEQILSIEQEIKELEDKKSELLLTKSLMRGLKGNPKHVARFMSLFNQRDGLKYLTHDFDESGDFDTESFLADVRKVCTENLGQLEIPQTLKDLLNQFAFEKTPKWTAFDNQFNPKEMQFGWSASEEAKDNKLHPIKLPSFAEIIRDFKRTTRIESPALEALIDKVFADETFEIEKKNLRKADFYTHIGELKPALETIFGEIKKRSDSEEKKKISVEYKRSTDDDSFVCQVKITHHNSYPTKEEDVLIKEWLSLEKGSMGKIAEHLQGYCHWSVVTKIEDKPMKVNILREKETPTQEDIDASEVNGFTHILTFYYH